LREERRDLRRDFEQERHSWFDRWHWWWDRR
jgi:hypothetical protein